MRERRLMMNPKFGMHSLPFEMCAKMIRREFSWAEGRCVQKLHDESIHDDNDMYEEHMYSEKNNAFDEYMSPDAIRGHIKDIVRGISDKSFELTDKNEDGYLDEDEIEEYINTKMGYSILVSPKLVVKHYDSDENGKLDKEEVWRIVETKDPDYFKILPEVMEQNMLLLHGGVQEDHLEQSPVVSEDGVVIRY
ncbi:unnamed protein product [Caenorhabditis bovis]|uniref:EF-hand domain-containing protein n=1 Tax=Caenorhabditis bovis TaxID=2654633 RepID=A0A8S1EH00_9PELO|nr:unnamed protein product [Caenorhabditis bovis]